MGEQKIKEANGAFNLDTILSELGSFGKYHLLMLFLLAFRDSFLNMCNLNYVFTAAAVEYRCQVSECETDKAMFNRPWLSAAFPNNTDHCQRYHPVFVEVQNASTEPPSVRGHGGNRSCPSIMFDKGKLMECDRWVYADNNTIVSEFDLGCQDWKRTTLGTVHNVGLIVSLILSGLISDRYGRKTIIVATPLLVGVVGLIKSFSVSYWMLVILEFIETAFGYGNASLVLSLECVSQDRRVVFACILDMLSNFGGMFFGLIAWSFPYWRHTLRVIYSPLLIVFFYIFFIDEGVRWLLAKGRKNEAIRILNKVAKVNNIKLSNVAKDMMHKIECTKPLENNPEEKSQLPLLTSLKSKSIWLRLISCSFCNMCSAFIYNGIIVNSANLSGNKYLNYSLVMLVAIPTRLVTAMVLNRFGRKIPMAVAFFLCAIFLVSASFVPKELHWLSISLFLLGKMAISFGFYTLMVYTLEVFPTCTRNSLTNISCTIGRLGSVLAPQTPLLVHLREIVYMHSLPNLIFGLVALMAGTLILFMPDTGNSKLPDNVHEVEETDDLQSYATNDKEAV